MAQSSPFAPYANFTARFQVQDSGLVEDADGNMVPLKSWVQVTAVMQDMGRINPRNVAIDNFPGLNTNARTLDGFVVSPLPDTPGGNTYLDTLIDWRTPAEATMDGKVGLFYWDQALRDPFLLSVKVDIVREFKGYFVEGAAITIEGDRLGYGRSTLAQSFTITTAIVASGESALNQNLTMAVASTPVPVYGTSSFEQSFTVVAAVSGDGVQGASTLEQPFTMTVAATPTPVSGSSSLDQAFTSTITATGTPVDGSSELAQSFTMTGAATPTPILGSSALAQPFTVTAAGTPSEDPVVTAIASSLPNSPSYRRQAMADAISLAVSSTNAKYSTTFTATDLINLLASNAWYWRFEPGLARDVGGQPVTVGSDITVLVDMLKGVEMRSDHTGRRFLLTTIGAGSQISDIAIAPVGDSGNWSAIAFAKTSNAAGDQAILQRGEATTGTTINGGGTTLLRINSSALGVGSVGVPGAPSIAGNNLIRARANGTAFTGAINGQSSTATITAGTAQPYISMGRAGFSFNFGYRSLLYLDTAVTDSQFQLLQAFVVAMESLDRVICDGDSITFGTGLTVATSYPSVLSAALDDGYVVTNFGVPSQTVADMSSDFATQIAPLSGNVWQRKILVAFGGSNDISIGGASAATLISRIQSYCNTATAAGYTVILCTILPRSNAATPASFEADRQTVNTWIRANYLTIAHGLADLAADSRIGDAGDELDTTYYQADRVHPTAAGAAIIAETVQGAISALPAGTPTNRRGFVVHRGDAVVGSTLTAIAHDPNGISSTTWGWQSSADGLTGWATIGGATSQTYVIGSLAGQYIRPVATITDSAGNVETVYGPASAQIAASADPVLSAIATSLPYVPASRRAAVKASAEFADSGNPTGVITLLASFDWIVSLDAADGCMYTSWANTTDPADTNADLVGSLWSWNTRNSPYFNQDDSALQPAIASGVLRIADGKVVTGQPYNGWTQGEKFAVWKTDADPPATTDRFEAMALAESSAITASGTALTNAGALVDGWGINGTTGLRPQVNPTVSLTTYNLHRSTAITGQRTVQINLEAAANNTTAGTTGFQAWYALGTSSGSGGNPDYRFRASRQTPLSTSDRTIVQRFISHYYGLGLY